MRGNISLFKNVLQQAETRLHFPPTDQFRNKMMWICRQKGYIKRQKSFP